MYDDPSADPNDQMDETSPEQEEATFSKMLRDVWRRTCESLRVAFPHVSHRFTLVLAFLGSLLVGGVWFCLFWVVFCVCFVLEGSPRCRDVVVFFPTS